MFIKFSLNTVRAFAALLLAVTFVPTDITVTPAGNTAAPHAAKNIIADDGGAGG